MPDDESRFTEIFKESIKETIQDIVGQSPSQALLFHLGFPGSAERPAEFDKNLRAILLAGSSMMELAIVKRLWDKMGLFLIHANEPGSFEERITRARELFSERQKQRQVFAS